ncbi:hypothetical protein [Bacillus sp. EB01]|uniref:hypothetical protein n=1 Tax=Bacillus sp. EB01 TaxID=1347086 RepID=UPI0005C501A5|nr:hypothetical protein [Bacillus sp. EB01]
MSLFLSIVLSAILGFFLFTIGPPEIAGIIAFGIIVGSIFRGLYLLNDIHKRISLAYLAKDKVQQAYEDYKKAKNTGSI